MSIKVVYNNCFGGFVISRACAERMAELGNKEAQSMIEIFNHRQTMIEREGHQFYGYIYETPRHDSALVQAVEELGEDASGDMSDLRVYELSGDKYFIDEYDGSETVVEPKDVVWIKV